jgi:hypothetical protein
VDGRQRGRHVIRIEDFVAALRRLEGRPSVRPRAGLVGAWLKDHVATRRKANTLRLYRLATACETEFAKVLRVMEREGFTLSAVLARRQLDLPPDDNLICRYGSAGWSV